MKKERRREAQEFSMSFLDVICCGFGAIILLLMITKTAEPIVLEKSVVDLDGQVNARKDTLFEIRGQVTQLQRQQEETQDALDERKIKRVRYWVNTPPPPISLMTPMRGSSN